MIYNSNYFYYADVNIFLSPKTTRANYITVTMKFNFKHVITTN